MQPGTFQDQEGFTGDEDAATPEAVEQLSLVGIYTGDDLGGNDLGFDPVLFLEAETVQTT